MSQPQIDTLFQYYEEALLEIYRLASPYMHNNYVHYSKYYYICILCRFYSASSDTKSRNMVQSLGNSVRTFDDHKTNKEDGPKEKVKGVHMSYADFLRFAGDFGLTSRWVYDIILLYICDVLISTVSVLH